MNKTKQQLARAEWQKRIEEAEAHPQGVAQYAREVGIPVTNLYCWKSKLKREAQAKERPQISAEKFCRVKVVEPKRPSLPDPKWVAEVILALTSGAR